jgi:hypothetical protein
MPPERDEFGVIFAECHINYRSPVSSTTSST